LRFQQQALLFNSGIVGIRWIHDQLERPSVTKTDGCEVAHVARRKTSDVE
jgi:hypothetical protein